MSRRKTGTLLYGIGKAAPIKQATALQRKARKVWGGMLERCYSPAFKAQHPTYKDCSVCKEWHDFDNFYSWFLKNYRENTFLDKDLRNWGNKIYSPDTCAFIPRWLNNLLLSSEASRGELPQGVTYDKGKYKARFSCNGSSKYLGLFDTAELAEKAYKFAKGMHLIDIISNNEEIPMDIKMTLSTISDSLIKESL